MTWGAALLVGLALMALYLPLSLLLTLQSWESRRFVHSTLKKPRQPRELPTAAIIVPLKGVDLQLKASLRSLLHQDYPDYEVHFVVETEQDPAYDIVQELIAEGASCRVHWHQAGCAGACGQKIHNLLTATRQLSPQVRLIAFIDSTLRPVPTWLYDLAYRIPSDLALDDGRAAPGWGR